MAGNAWSAVKGARMKGVLRVASVSVVFALATAGCGGTASAPGLDAPAAFDASRRLDGGEVGTADKAGTVAGQGGLRTVRDLPAPLNTAGGAEQPIAENDILKVDVFQVKDLDREVQVDSRGNISLPLIGEIKASGKTARALEQELEKLYGARYLQSPDVTVFVKESFGQRVTVNGEVRKAGIHPVTVSSSLISVISQAGGMNDIADPTKVYVFRNHGAERLVANYNVSRIRSGSRRDPRIYGGDVVVVFSSTARIAMKNLREALGIATSVRVFVP